MNSETEDYTVAAFGAGYPKTEEGWFQFPKDQQRRRELFPAGVFKHPAKANMFLIEELVKHLTKPGETLLDPFAGTGTLLLAAPMGRNVICLELESMFVDLINEAANAMLEDAAVQGTDGIKLGNVIVLPGDCRQLLPIPCDHAIFSPPYANVSVRSNPFTGRKTYDARTKGEGPDKFKEGLDAYSGKDSSRLNMGLLNPFFFGRQMQGIYAKLQRSIREDGTMTVITRDMMGSDGRVMLAKDVIRSATQAGFRMLEWHKHKRAGSPRTDLEESRGHEVIRDEDIVVFRRV